LPDHAFVRERRSLHTLDFEGALRFSWRSCAWPKPWKATQSTVAPHSFAASMIFSQSSREASGVPGVRIGSYDSPRCGAKRRMTSVRRFRVRRHLVHPSSPQRRRERRVRRCGTIRLTGPLPI
jgi:hypothetical protein